MADLKEKEKEKKIRVIINSLIYMPNFTEGDKTPKLEDDDVRLITEAHQTRRLEML